MMKRIPIALTLWLYAVATCQTDPLLYQSIQVVRDWLNNPGAEVRFMFKRNKSLHLFGPQNEFVFWYEPYEIVVNIDKMKVTEWSISISWWEEQARTDLPKKSEAEIIQIARNYANQYFPHFNEFSEWEITMMPDYVATQQIQEVIEYIVSFIPYVTNEFNIRIPVLTTLCSVGVDPYEGKVISFYQRHMPMTLTNLIPNFSVEEAKSKMEQAFLNLGAAQATAWIPATNEDYLFGLVIGATQTNGLRLAYSGGVEAVGAPGYEEEFGTSEEPSVWFAAIDAHTGELIYREPILGGAREEGLKQLLLYGLQYKQISSLFPSENQQREWVILIGLSLTVAIFLWAFWRWKRQRRA